MNKFVFVSCRSFTSQCSRNDKSLGMDISLHLLMNRNSLSTFDDYAWKIWTCHQEKNLIWFTDYQAERSKLDQATIKVSISIGWNIMIIFCFFEPLAYSAKWVFVWFENCVQFELFETCLTLGFRFKQIPHLQLKLHISAMNWTDSNSLCSIFWTHNYCQFWNLEKNTMGT